jgi:hypothetical protein
MITDCHAKYYAYGLPKRSPFNSFEKLAGSVASAQVDLDSHQVHAVLLRYHSPLSREVLLPDEVSLGERIEAGLMVAQRWPERKKRILIFTASNLCKQWQQEISKKFFFRARSTKVATITRQSSWKHFNSKIRLSWRLDLNLTN